MSLVQPEFISRDSGALLADAILQYEQLAGRQLYPAQAERLIIDLIMYREILTRAAIQDAGEQNLITYARDGMLDQLGEMVGASRLDGAPSRVLLRFTAAAPLATAMTIPAGTRVRAAATAPAFATEEPATIPEGGTYVEAWASSEVTGTETNGLPIGQGFAAVEALPGVVVTAASVSFGGAGAETDDRFRERVRLGAARQSVGSLAHWRYHALSSPRRPDRRYGDDARSRRGAGIRHHPGRPDGHADRAGHEGRTQRSPRAPGYRRGAGDAGHAG